jgi:hypothetical protein
MVGGAEWWLMNPEHWPEFYWIFNLKIQVVVLNSQELVGIFGKWIPLQKSCFRAF